MVAPLSANSHPSTTISSHVAATVRPQGNCVEVPATLPRIEPPVRKPCGPSFMKIAGILYSRQRWCGTALSHIVVRWLCVKQARSDGVAAAVARSRVADNERQHRNHGKVGKVRLDALVWRPCPAELSMQVLEAPRRAPARLSSPALPTAIIRSPSPMKKRSLLPSLRYPRPHRPPCHSRPALAASGSCEQSQRAHSARASSAQLCVDPPPIAASGGRRSATIPPPTPSRAAATSSRRRSSRRGCRLHPLEESVSRLSCSPVKRA